MLPEKNDGDVEDEEEPELEIDQTYHKADRELNQIGPAEGVIVLLLCRTIHLLYRKI